MFDTVMNQTPVQVLELRLRSAETLLNHFQVFQGDRPLWSGSREISFESGAAQSLQQAFVPATIE
jgi:hypothetical protein